MPSVSLSFNHRDLLKGNKNTFIKLSMCTVVITLHLVVVSEQTTAVLLPGSSRLPGLAKNSKSHNCELPGILQASSFAKTSRRPGEVKNDLRPN